MAQDQKAPFNIEEHLPSDYHGRSEHGEADGNAPINNYYSRLLSFRRQKLLSSIQAPYILRNAITSPYSPDFLMQVGNNRERGLHYWLAAGYELSAYCFPSELNILPMGLPAMAIPPQLYSASASPNNKLGPIAAALLAAKQAVVDASDNLREAQELEATLLRLARRRELRQASHELYGPDKETGMTAADHYLAFKTNVGEQR